MESRRIKQADLPPILDSRGGASEVFNGKLAISKAQAKKLGEFFGVSPAIFVRTFDADWRARARGLPAAV